MFSKLKQIFSHHTEGNGIVQQKDKQHVLSSLQYQIILKALDYINRDNVKNKSLTNQSLINLKNYLIKLELAQKVPFGKIYTSYIKLYSDNYVLVPSTYLISLVKRKIYNIKQHANQRDHIYYYTTNMVKHTKITIPHYCTKQEQEQIKDLKPVIKKLHKRFGNHPIIIDKNSYALIKQFPFQFNQMFRIRNKYLYVGSHRLCPSIINRNDLRAHFKHILSKLKN